MYKVTLNPKRTLKALICGPYYYDTSGKDWHRNLLNAYKREKHRTQCEDNERIPYGLHLYEECWERALDEKFKK